MVLSNQYLIPMARPAMLAMGVASLLLGSCAAEPDEMADAWAELAAEQLSADGLTDGVIDCVLDVAADDLERGPLGELATEELVASCRRARVVIERTGGDDQLGAALALIDVRWTVGDDPALDRLWQACEDGSGAACDELFDRSPVGSDYEAFGLSCGGRPDVLHCAELDQVE